MPDNQLSDEALISAFFSGVEDALTVLCERYLNILKFFLYPINRSRNNELLEDIIQQTFLKVIQAIKSGKFNPDMPGKFKSYLFETAKRICLSFNQKQASQFKPASEVFPKEPTGIPDDVFTQRDMDVSPYDYYRHKLQKVLPILNDVEKRLLELVSEGKSFKEIHENDPVLSKYSIDYLKEMMYIIKKKIRKKQE